MERSFGLAMITAPRKEQYALESARSLREAGFDQTLHVFAEPNSWDLSKGYGEVNVHWNKNRLGCFKNWKSALTWMFNHVDAEWYMIVQDDVKYRDDCAYQLGKAIDSGKFDHVGFLSPYTSPEMVPPGKRDAKGWVQARHGPGRGFWGALTVAMPRQSVKQLLDHQRFISHTHHRKVDVVIGNCFRDIGKQRLVCVPSLCDHIGNVSTLGRHRIKGIKKGRKGYKFRPRFEK